MAQRLFALFQTESEAEGALTGLKNHPSITGKYDALIHTTPWTPVGPDGGVTVEAATWSVGRFNLLVGGLAGGALALLFKTVLGIVHSPIPIAVGIGTLSGAALGALIGLAIGRVFPDGNLQAIATQAVGGKVVLDVGVGDSSTRHIVWKLLRQHHARRIAQSQV